jgi:hypothetical protein
MEVIGGLQGALGIVPTPITHSNKISMTRPTEQNDGEGSMKTGVKEQNKVDPEEMSPISLRDLKIKNRFNSFKENIYKLGFKNIINAQQLEDGIQLDIPMDFLFGANSDELKPGASRWMEPFASLVASMGNETRLTAALTSGESVLLARRRLETLAFALNARYKVDPNRISIGVDIAPEGGKSTLKAMIADKFISRELSMTDFFKTRSDDKKKGF